MNASNAAQFLPLVQALADGKKIEILDHHTKKWRDLNDPQFTSNPECYRIKPEPREWHGKVVETTRAYENGYRDFTIRIPSDPKGDLPELGPLSVREIL